MALGVTYQRHAQMTSQPVLRIIDSEQLIGLVYGISLYTSQRMLTIYHAPVKTDLVGIDECFSGQIHRRCGSERVNCSYS
jgi:hypothetical protein